MSTHKIFEFGDEDHDIPERDTTGTHINCIPSLLSFPPQYIYVLVNTGWYQLNNSRVQN